MSITKPFYRTCRPFLDNGYSNSGLSGYITHLSFAKSPAHFIQAFLLIQKDVLSLFDYIEPADKNLTCYSFRIHELLLRVCVEVEANFKAILKENGYSKSNNLNMLDYSKVDQSHRLSSYQVKIPRWMGGENIITPFDSFLNLDDKEKSPKWYRSYNNVKHDRYENFEEANFENLIHAVAGLVVLLSSQFHTTDFSPGPTLLSVSDGAVYDGMTSAIGGFFRIKFPDDFPMNERYSFSYEDIRKWKEEGVCQFGQYKYK